MDANYFIKAFFRGLMCLLGILGNHLLCFHSLPRLKSRLQTNKVLLINLAFSNLITNYLVDLPDIMAYIVGHWFMGEAYCGLFLFCSDLSETSSIFTMLFICVYWHKKLVGSLKFGGAPIRLDSVHLVAYFLAGSWAVALVFSIPHFFFIQRESDNDSQKECIELLPSTTARKTYDTVYLTFANALPIVAILFASIQIVITLLRNQMHIQNMTSDCHKGTALPNNHGNMEASVTDDKISDKEANLPGAPDIRPHLPGASGSERQYAGSSVAPITMPHYQVPIRSSRVTDVSDLQRPSHTSTKPSPGAGIQVRAVKNVVAVATVFLVCWVTHLLLRIFSNISNSLVAMEMTNYFGSSYTCTIPYILLYGEKKLGCSCRGMTDIQPGKK